MSEVKLPADIETALEVLDKIIEEGKSVPLKDSLIMVDKNSLREVYTKIYREKSRIKELRNEYLADAEEKAQSIISNAKQKATEILESAVSNTPLESDMNIKVALEIKENTMEYLEHTLRRLDGIMSSYNDLFSEVQAHVAEFDIKNK